MHTVRELVAAVTLLFVAGCNGPSETSSPPTSPVVAAPSIPASPVTDRLKDCMTDAGWSVSRSWSGGIESDEIPQEQLEAYNDSLAICSESSGWSRMANITEEQKEELYEQELANHACLTELDIESADPPTRETYLTTYLTADQYYSFLPGFDSLDQASMQEAVVNCPPPTWFMNVSGFER